MNFSDESKMYDEFEMDEKVTEMLTKEDDVERRYLEILMAVSPIVVPLLFTIIMINNFLGNLLVILVVILNKTMRNTTEILNLVVSKGFTLTNQFFRT